MTILSITYIVVGTYLLLSTYMGYSSLLLPEIEGFSSFTVVSKFFPFRVSRTFLVSGQLSSAGHFVFDTHKSFLPFHMILSQTLELRVKQIRFLSLVIHPIILFYFYVLNTSSHLVRVSPSCRPVG